MKNISELRQRIIKNQYHNVLSGYVCIGIDDIYEPLYEHFNIDSVDIIWNYENDLWYITKELALKHNLISENQQQKSMKTKVEYNPSVQELKVGQVWRELSSKDLYLICGDGKDTYWAVCLTGKVRQIGETVYNTTPNISEVFYKPNFEYVPTMTITTP